MRKHSKEPLVSDEAHIIATQLVDKKRILSSVDVSIHHKLLAPLAAYRNQAIFLKQEEKKLFIEQIISELVLLPPTQNNNNHNNNRPPTNPEPKPRQIEKPVQITIKVSAKERQYINKVIDLLLTDSEIDTIDPEFIPKMLVVLKERKQKAQLNADLYTSRQIQQQMKKLQKIAHSPEFNSQTKQKMIDSYNQILNRISQLRLEYQEKINTTLEQKEEAKNKIIESNNKDVIAFEEEREALESGDEFMPSSTLRELYRKVKVVESLEEKQYLQKQIEKQENSEMYDYLQKTDRLMKNKKERLKKSFYGKKQLFEEQWESKQRKIKTHYNQLIAQEKVQLETMKKKLLNAGIEPPPPKSEYESVISNENKIQKFKKDDSIDFVQNHEHRNENEEPNNDDDLNESISNEIKNEEPRPIKQNENKSNVLAISQQKANQIQMPNSLIKKDIQQNSIKNASLKNADSIINSSKKENPLLKEKNPQSKSKFKEMVMKIFGNENQLQDNYLDLDIDLNQDSDLIDLNEFHVEEANNDDADISPMPQQKKQPVKNHLSKGSLNSDLIFFSQEKEDTEVQFFTDDGSDCSMIRLKNNQNTSAIFEDNVFNYK